MGIARGWVDEFLERKRQKFATIQHDKKQGKTGSDTATA